MRGGADGRCRGHEHAFPPPSLHVSALLEILDDARDRVRVDAEEAGQLPNAGQGLVARDTAKEKPQEGKVVAVGTGKVNDDGKNFPLAVKEGDRILFGKYSGNEVKLDGVEYLIMKEEDVLGILGS